jgi:hypothetical protein
MEAANGGEFLRGAPMSNNDIPSLMPHSRRQAVAVGALEPFAVRPKVAAQLDACGITEFYKRLNRGEYETFVDGGARLVTVRSIRARQERLLTAASGTPREKPSARRGGPGRPRKKSTA